MIRNQFNQIFKSLNSPCVPVSQMANPNLAQRIPHISLVSKDPNSAKLFNYGSSWNSPSKESLTKVLPKAMGPPSTMNFDRADPHHRKQMALSSVSRQTIDIFKRMLKKRKIAEKREPTFNRPSLKKVKTAADQRLSDQTRDMLFVKQKRPCPKKTKTSEATLHLQKPCNEKPNCDDPRAQEKASLKPRFNTWMGLGNLRFEGCDENLQKIKKKRIVPDAE